MLFNRNSLTKYFVIPEKIRAIDYERVKLKDKKLISSEIELPFDLIIVICYLKNILQIVYI